MILLWLFIIHAYYYIWILNHGHWHKIFKKTNNQIYRSIRANSIESRERKREKEKKDQWIWLNRLWYWWRWAYQSKVKYITNSNIRMDLEIEKSKSKVRGKTKSLNWTAFQFFVCVLLCVQIMQIRSSFLQIWNIDPYPSP